LINKNKIIVGFADFVKINTKYPVIPAEATIVPFPHMAITRQPIELASCSITPKMCKVLQSQSKKWASFGFKRFCLWRHNWSRFSFLDDVIGYWDPNSRNNFCFFL